MNKRAIYMSDSEGIQMSPLGKGAVHSAGGFERVAAVIRTFAGNITSGSTELSACRNPAVTYLAGSRRE